jgi:hypothetical protein
MLVIVLGTMSDVALLQQSGLLLGLGFAWLGKAAGFVGWSFSHGARHFFLQLVSLHLNRPSTKDV